MDRSTPESSAFCDETIATTNDLAPGTWAERYLAANGDDVDAYSHLVREVEEDEIDPERFENEIQRMVPAMNIMDGFCGKCRQFLQHWPDMSTTQWALANGRSFSSVCEIEAATIAGCKFCAFLHSRLVHRQLLDVFQKIESWLGAFGHDGSTTLTIEAWGEGHLQSHIMWLNFPGKKATVCTSRGGSAVKFFSDVTEPLRGSWQHEENSNIYELARMWLRECDNFHETCLHEKKYERPSRLVSFDRDVVRVVRTAIFDTMPKYATLSYCWGPNPFLSLTRNTMELFLEGIYTRDLPQTFRDAIQVAKELGLSYIWIDALCIIQHDPEDWFIEASRMRSVYGNSYVNLAASSATNVHQGFFSRAKDYTHYNGGFCARVSTSECSSVRNFYSSRVYEETVENTHLATRAWTMQERLLPARTISFGNMGIFWECRSGIRSEFFPCGVPRQCMPHLVCPEDQAWNWNSIISQYSCANLTEPEDKLPALAGIARRQHEATGHQYLAGMWKESLVTDLTWGVLNERRRKPAWRAPSWSWIAVDSQVTAWGQIIIHTRIKQYISILGVWATPAGPDLFGKVSDGLLSLACTALVRAHLLSYDNNAEKDSDEHEPQHIQYIRCIKLDAVIPILPVWMDTLDEKGASSEVYLMPVFGGPSGIERTQKQLKNRNGREKNLESHEINDNNTPDVKEERMAQLVMYGLILRACDQNTGDGGRFSRAGLFVVKNFNDVPFDGEPERDDYQHFIELLDGEGQEMIGANTRSGPENTSFIQRDINITIE